MLPCPRMIQFLAFLFFTGLVAVIAWQKTRRDDHHSSTGYFLAGRSLGWLVIAGSLLLTNLSTEQLVGLNGGAYANGMQVMAWEVWSSIAIVLMALIFLPRYLKSGIATVSAFLQRRYSKAVGIAVSALLLFSLLTNIMPFVLYSGALFMSESFNVPAMFGGNERAALWATVIALGVVGSLYAIVGGLKAVAVSDTINGIGLLIGGLLIPILGIVAIGNELAGGGGLGAGFNYLTENAPEKLNPVGGPDDNIPFSTLFTGMLVITTFYWCTNQAIVQRTFAAKSLEQGQKGVLFAAAMKLLGPFYLVLPGIIAWHLFPGLEDSDDAYGQLVGKVLPTWMLGFFAAVLFGAILSSFNSSLNSAVTLFCIDIYKGTINQEASDARTVAVGKWFGVAVAASAIVLAPLIHDLKGQFGGLFDLMKQLAALYNVPLLAVVLIGIFHRRATSRAALAALATGVAFQAIFGLWQGNSLFGIELHWLHLAGINFLLLVAVMYVISAIAPRPEPYVQEYTEEVDIQPWRWAVPCGVAILVAIAAMYLLMSRF